ncbi:hypothetical protein D9757_014712 [Collybiopsis confluens]|uniref:Uncharacterized protein n=1 Tax=Collybiopsis confluens TaxID=2823264 RepID=A0A8H5FI07_9AGAR|nr:hypothetical protein D9757_014712 [Collybiopsis confluens]
MVAKHSKSQNGEEFPATSSSALDARIYQTAPNYTSSQYFQRHSQAPTLSSVMPRYSNNYSQVTTAHQNNIYGGTQEQVQYPQTLELFTGSYTNQATWSTPTLPVHSYSSLSGYSDTSRKAFHLHGACYQPPPLDVLRLTRHPGQPMGVPG